MNLDKKTEKLTKQTIKLETFLPNEVFITNTSGSFVHIRESLISSFLGVQLSNNEKQMKRRIIQVNESSLTLTDSALIYPIICLLMPVNFLSSLTFQTRKTLV